jgi:hypothetical protein
MPIERLRPLTQRPAHRIGLNITLLLLALALVRLAMDRLFELTLPDAVSVWGAATAGAAGFIGVIIPKRVRAEALTLLRSMFASSTLTKVCCALAGAALLMCGLVRYEISWVGPELITLTINGGRVDLRGTATADGRHVAARLYPAGLPFKVALGKFTIAANGYPLANRSLTLPLFVTSNLNGRSAVLENKLLSAFYQFFEQRQLQGAREMMDAYRPTNSTESALLARSESIYRILYLSFVEADPNDSKYGLIRYFQDKYSKDPWSNLLEAARYYSLRNYSKCYGSIDRSYLEYINSMGLNSMSATARFFSGICRMRHAMQVGRKAQMGLLGQATSDLISAEQESANLKDDGLKAIAYPSSIIFQGIAHFYSGDFDSAVDTYDRATEISTGSIQARAINAAGFSRLVQGDIASAGGLFLRAFESDPNFPYARSNYGFVLLAENHPEEAEYYFRKNAEDLKLQKESQRDVTLAKLSLATLYDLRGAPLALVNQKYADLLSELNANTYSAVDPPEVRYAYLTREAAKKIYLGGQYYGLEVFALTLLCRAQHRLAYLAPNGNSQAARVVVANDISELRSRVNPLWLSGRREGWFSSLNDCH